MAGHFLRLLILIYCQICLNEAARGITFSLSSVTSQVEPFGPITPIVDKSKLQDTTILDRDIVRDASNIKNLDVSALHVLNENDKCLKDPINFRPYNDPSKVRPDFYGNWPPHSVNTFYDPNFQNKDLFNPYGNTLYPIFTQTPVSSISPEFNVRLPVTNERNNSLISPTSLGLKTSNNISSNLATTLDSTMTLPMAVTTPLKLKPSISNFEPCSLVKVPPAPMASVTINPLPTSQISQIFYSYNYLIPSPNMLPKPKIPFYTHNFHELNTPPNTFKQSTVPYFSAFHNMYTASLARSEFTPNYLNHYQQVPKIEIPLSLRESCYEFNKKLVENFISVQLSKGNDHSYRPVSYDQSCCLSSPALLNYYSSSPNSLSSDTPPSPNTSPGFSISFPVKSFPAEDSVQHIIPNSFSRTLGADVSCSKNILVMQELPLNTHFDMSLSPLCVDSPITEEHIMPLLSDIPSSNVPKLDSTPIVYENTVLSAIQFGDFSIDSTSPIDPKTFKRSSEISLCPGINSDETNTVTIVEKKDCIEGLLSDHSIPSCKKAIEKLLEILALVESIENMDKYEWDTLHTIISLLSVL